MEDTGNSVLMYVKCGSRRRSFVTRLRRRNRGSESLPVRELKALGFLK